MGQKRRRGEEMLSERFNIRTPRQALKNNLNDAKFMDQGTSQRAKLKKGSSSTARRRR